VSGSPPDDERPFSTEAHVRRALGLDRNPLAPTERAPPTSKLGDPLVQTVEKPSGDSMAKPAGRRGRPPKPPAGEPRSEWLRCGQEGKGKKRHIVVDTIGLLLHAVIHPADIQVRDGGTPVVSTLFGRYPFLVKLFADAGYQGSQFQSAITTIMEELRWTPETGQVAKRESRP
jgi:hypothetical protein